MKKIKILFLSTIIITIAFCSCSRDDYDLEPSTFVPDPVNSDLPEYSELGYNTFGAYFGRKPFVSNNSEVPLKIIIKNDTLNLQFTGIFYDDDKKTKAVLNFAFIGVIPYSYENLDVLADKKYNLTDTACIVTIKYEEYQEVFKIIEGRFEILKVQNLVIDNIASKAILSGKFQFQTYIDNDPTTISNGRFDVTVGYENFFSIR
ncbi:MAG: hypothetical protein LBV69_02185 [Bacteroidales bacterium]|jgi:hypothetical protein|nr:hypothetical protein [Bacteroidales bacterium]